MTFSQIAALALIASFTTAARGDDAKEDLDGIWTPSKAELGGHAFPDEVRKSIKLEIKGDKYTVTVGEETDKGTSKADPSAKPKALDVMGEDGPNKGKTFLAIYELDGDVLRVCYDLTGKARPTEFKSKEGTQLFLVEYKRQKP